MLILSQFVLRLSFGLSLAMGLTSPRKVTSGFFRNHSYVLLGLNVLAVLAALAETTHSHYSSAIDWSIRYETPPVQTPAHLLVWPPVLGALLSYVCAAVWLYEKPVTGRVMLLAIAAISLYAIWSSQPIPFFSELHVPTPWQNISVYVTSATAPIEPPLVLWRLSAIFSGLLLGTTIAAMFLGHWYLNTPTMELKPLRFLIEGMAMAVVLEAALSGLALTLELREPWISSSDYIFIALRWLSGIVGTAILTWMAWRTLKIPNTQSATGILYVAVVTTFLGELTSLLLSRGTAYPL
jgi:hypothetical protein